MPIPDLQDIPVLVTGGAGFIGSHIVDALVEIGARVAVLDNLSTGKIGNLARYFEPADFLPFLHPEALQDNGRPQSDFSTIQSSEKPVTFIVGDIRNFDTCRAACSGIGYVSHQAALGSIPRSMKDPATTLAVNLQGTANLFSSARDAGVKRVVYASSSSVYGDSNTLPKREGEEGKPLSPYAFSKVMDEKMAEVFSGCFGQELIGLRYFNVYGPRQDFNGPYAAVIPKFFHSFLADEAPTIFGDGEQSRDFTFVSDAVRANLLAIGADEAACGAAYNVASGARTTINRLGTLIRDMVGGGPKPLHRGPRPGDVLHSLADTTSALEAIGYVSQVALREGLQNTFDYYQKSRP